MESRDPRMRRTSLSGLKQQNQIMDNEYDLDTVDKKNT